jgi:prophage antirepressor-like protein
MNTQMIIKEFQTKQITMIKDDDMNVWFKGRDVAQVLEYADAKQAIRKGVPEKYKKKMCELVGCLGDAPTKTQSHTIFINEAGLYKLVFRSNKKEAEEFTDWIAESVLPSIRKTGSYTMPTKDTRAYIEDALMIEGILNAKIQMLLNDRLANELQGTDNNVPKEQWSRDIVTIVKQELNKNITFTEAANVGKYVVKKYRINFNKDPRKYDKFVNGNTRSVFAYTKDEEVNVIEWIHEYYH